MIFYLFKICMTDKKSRISIQLRVDFNEMQKEVM